MKRKSNIPVVFMPINGLFASGYLSLEKLKLLADQPQQGLYCLHWQKGVRFLGFLSVASGAGRAASDARDS